MNGEIETRLIGEADVDLLVSADTSVFDNPVDPALARAYLAHPDYVIALATQDGTVVGMATGLFYFHPDKPLEFFVNEVGVAESHWRRGIAGRLMAVLFDAARARGVRYAWVGTETGNTAANALYRSFGPKGQEMMFYEFDLTAPREG